MSFEDIFMFTWKIEHFSMLPHQNGNYLQSPFFTINYFNESQTDWCLRLYPRGVSSECENWMSCFLDRKSADSPIPIGFSFEIKSVDEVRNIVKETGKIEVVTNIGIGYPKFLSLEFLNDYKHNFLPHDVFTIKCKIWSPDGEEMAFEPKSKIPKLEPSSLINESSYLTRIQVGRKCVTWPIKKVKSLLENKNKTFLSVDSSSENSPCFKLSFFFSKNVECKHAQIEITQAKSSLKKKNMFVKCKVTVMSVLEECQHSQEDSILFRSDVSEVWRIPEFIEIANLLQDKYRIHLDDTLYLSFEFSFTFEGDGLSHNEIPKCMPNAFKILKTSEMSTFGKKIQKLYQDKKFCDVTLEVDDRTFPAQKLVLCAQSPVFCAMFENDMKEKKTNVVEVVDVDEETMDRMLEFLHCDSLEEDLSVEGICKLYSAADKYQISLLKQQCTFLLLSTLSLKNVGEILTFADFRQDDFLMTHVCDFLKNAGTESFLSPDWEEYLNCNPALFGKVMLRILKDSTF